jgi:hypothetical protein
LAETQQVRTVRIGDPDPLPALACPDQGGVDELQATAFIEEARDDLGHPQPAAVAFLIKDTWPRSLRLRCWVHKMRNVLDKVPDAARPEMKA